MQELLLIAMALFTGLRQGELLGLTWNCVDFEKGTLLINKQHNRAKGGESVSFFQPQKQQDPISDGSYGGSECTSPPEESAGRVENACRCVVGQP